MKYTRLLPVAAGMLLASQFASASTTVLPGVALPAGAPALPDLTLGVGGALAIPGVPSLPGVPGLPAIPGLPGVPALPIPTSGGSLAVTGGIGGPAYVVKPTTITAEGVDLPALPAGGLAKLPGLPQ